MEIKIIQKKKNPLLSRLEVEAEASFLNEATPKKGDVKKKIASMEKADENLVVVKNISMKFGEGKANFLTYIYESKDKLIGIEPKKKSKKGTGGEAKKEDGKGEEPKKE